MYEPRPGDIALPPTVSVDLSHLVGIAVAAATPVTAHADTSEHVA